MSVVIPLGGKPRKILASEKDMRSCQGDALFCLKYHDCRNFFLICMVDSECLGREKSLDLSTF
jgi:hypothetical protein